MKTPTPIGRMQSLRQILDEWKKYGYVVDFNALTKNSENTFELSPDEFQIDKTYRVDEMSDPEEQFIVYGISSKRNPRLKGTFVNGYGVYSDTTNNKIIERLGMAQAKNPQLTGKSSDEEPGRSLR